MPTHLISVNVGPASQPITGSMRINCLRRWPNNTPTLGHLYTQYVPANTVNHPTSYICDAVGAYDVCFTIHLRTKFGLRLRGARGDPDTHRARWPINQRQTHGACILVTYVSTRNIEGPSIFLGFKNGSTDRHMLAHGKAKNYV